MNKVDQFFKVEYRKLNKELIEFFLALILLIICIIAILRFPKEIHPAHGIVVNKEEYVPFHHVEYIIWFDSSGHQNNHFVDAEEFQKIHIGQYY